MSNGIHDIKILDQMELSADMLIKQLIEFKNSVTRLRSRMPDVSTPGLNNGSHPLSDHEIAALLNSREKTIQKRSKK